MRAYFTGYVFVAVCGLGLFAGCGSSSSSSSSTKNLSTRFAVNGVTSSTATLMENEDHDSNILFPSLQEVGGGMHIFSSDMSQSGTTAGNLSSLQFYVSRIQLCNSLTPTGSGYSDTSGCIYIFGDSATDNAYDTYKVANAAADTTSTNWVDLMSSTSISSFASNSGTAATAGTYNFAIIETRKPVKMNAQFTTGGGATLRTCQGGTVSSSGSGNSLLETVTVSNMQTCTRGLLTTGYNGGGKWFKFQSPVTIESGKTYVLDLAYNSDNAILGGNFSGGPTTFTYTDGTYSMNPPSLDVSPVLRQSTQKTIREQYTIAMTDLTCGGSSGGTLVLDLYYVGDKTNVGTGTIVGAQTRFVVPTSATYALGAPVPYSITTSGSTITIKDYAGNAIISGLTRSTTSTAGGTQTVTVTKSNFGNSGGSGATPSGSASYTATFTGLLSM